MSFRHLDHVHTEQGPEPIVPLREKVQALYEDTKERVLAKGKKNWRDEMGEDEKAGADLRAALAAHDATEAGASSQAANGLRFALAQGATKCGRCGVYLLPGDEVLKDEFGADICARHEEESKDE